MLRLLLTSVVGVAVPVAVDIHVVVAVDGVVVHVAVLVDTVAAADVGVVADVCFVVVAVVATFVVPDNSCSSLTEVV